MSSEHELRIFLSSTVYDLIDLRASLEEHLRSLGYKPILSDAAGFPTGSGDCEPQEACLKALEACHVVILIIDRRYGSEVTWPTYGKFFDGRTLSPTHGEFLYALHLKKKVMVFIRDSVLSLHGQYRQLQASNSKVEQAIHSLCESGHVDRGVLELIDDVLASSPTHYYHRFKAVPDIKREVQTQLINILAETFHDQRKELTAVVAAINKLLVSMNEEERQKVLGQIQGVNQTIEELEKECKEKATLQAKLESTEEQLREAAQPTDQLEALMQQKIDLEQKILDLEGRTGEALTKLRECEEGYYVPEIAYTPANYTNLSASMHASLHAFSDPGACWPDLGPQCEACCCSTGSSAVIQPLRTCPGCSRQLCENCWPSVCGPECSECCAKNGLSGS